MCRAAPYASPSERLLQTNANCIHGTRLIAPHSIQPNLHIVIVLTRGAEMLFTHPTLTVEFSARPAPGSMVTQL